MQSFIRVTEIWTPSATGKELSLNNGIYGSLQELNNHSLSRTFAYGEGLPGEAWKTERPVVLRDFENSSFLRTEIAQKVDLTSAVAIPIIAGDILKAVLVFLCGNKKQPNGAIEVWRDDKLSGLSLVDGYYGNLSRFASLSKHVKFPRGRGLPGMVWQSRLPLLMSDIANSNSFLRANSAAEAKITTGVGIPFYSPQNRFDMDAVITFLSSNETPIAQRFEVWLPDRTRDRLYFHSGVEHGVRYVEETDQSRIIRRGEGTIGSAWNTGIPVILSGDHPELILERHYTESKHYHSILAIPIYNRDFIVAVMAFYS